MLDPESEQTREVYAWFGLAIHNAQCLERELAMFLAGSSTSQRFTAWDYDDRLAANFESTFGILVAMFADVAQRPLEPLVCELRKAVEERNELIHAYFWNRAVQFSTTEGRAGMIEELQSLAVRFYVLDNEISKLVKDLMNERGVSQETIKEHIEAMLAGAATPHDPKGLRNSVLISGAYEWRVEGSVKCAVLFDSDAGNLILGEKGLCLGPQNIPSEHRIIKTEFGKALPATVNPKPKKAGSWNYVIPLANNYELRVRPDEKDGRHVVRFGLRRRKASR